MNSVGRAPFVRHRIFGITQRDTIFCDVTLLGGPAPVGNLGLHLTQIWDITLHDITLHDISPYDVTLFGGSAPP